MAAPETAVTAPGMNVPLSDSAGVGGGVGGGGVAAAQHCRMKT